LLEIWSAAQLLEASRSRLVYCYEGYRATTAASILKRERAGDVSVLIDGIEGWSASGLPLAVADSG
jgi:rhodanese-related sulfurtransferase